MCTTRAEPWWPTARGKSARCTSFASTSTAFGPPCNTISDGRLMASTPIRRNRHGGIDVRLSSDERELLLVLGPQLRTLLTDDPDDPSLKRLFPPAYVDDTEAESFYRLLARDELLNRRLANLDSLERAAKADRLSEEEALTFLNALNDLRLVLG